MEFKFLQQSPTDDHHNKNESHQPKKSWQFTYLGGNFRETIKSPPENSFSLVEMKKGSWGQVAALPRNGELPIVGVAVGTYMLVLGTTNRGSVRVQVIGKQVTLARAIAQQIYLQPFYFNN